ncbi:MAG: preprotein translocase subunit YajC [bacterium]
MLPLPALAQQPGEPNPMVTLVMFGGLFLFMYFLIIRPQRKRQKDHQNLIGALNKGDEVVMSSGMLGKITRLEGDYLVVQVTDAVELKFQKIAVHAVLPKGTIKSV